MESDCSFYLNEELFTGFSPDIPRGEEVCILKNSKIRENKKGHPFGWPFDFSKALRSSRRFGLRGFFCFRRNLFAFDVAFPALSIFYLVGLSAH